MSALSLRTLMPNTAPEIPHKVFFAAMVGKSTPGAILMRSHIDSNRFSFNAVKGKKKP